MTKTTKITFTTVAKTIKEQIKQVAGEHKSFKGNIEMLSINVLMHACKHGDPDLATALVHSCNGVVRTDAMVTWLTKHGPFIQSKDKTTGAFMFKLNKKVRQAINEELKDTSVRAYVSNLRKEKGPFELTKDSTFKGHNVPSKVIALIKHTKKIMQDDAKKDHEKNDFSLLKELEALVRKAA